MVSNCVFSANSASGKGGGAYNGTLVNCTFTNNYGWVGGAACSAVLNRCALANNRSYYGGGANGSTLTGCTLTGNFTYVDSDYTANGGGACASTLNNCVLAKNSSNNGGGASGSTLVNCTVVGNTCVNAGGGGVVSSALTNCIVYFNTAPGEPNYSDDSVLVNCDTTPLATNGVNNISSDPLFADSVHISSISPCRGAGIFSAASGVDIDGDAWLNPPSIGVDEFNASSATGALAVAFSETFTNVVTGLAVDFAAQISGHATDNHWNFGDGTIVSNRLNFSHSWSAPGNYTVTFTAFNTDNPGGVSASVTIFVLNNPVHYVALGNPNPVAPYFSWATAATNIQDAVDAAFAGGTLIVSNGVYQTGGRIVSGLQSNRVAVTKPLAIRSVNGPAVTVIQGNYGPGDSAVRCVYLTNHCTLTGFALNGGATRTAGYDSDQTAGGGAWCGDADIVVSNCVFSGNSAVSGGGAFQGTLLNCWFLANKSGANGGGANSATLRNCVFADNSAGGSGGGADNATLGNCIVYFNTAPDQPNYAGSTLNFCCATPLAGGTSNVTSAPLLLDYAHIASNSPCIGAGTNYFSGTDIDGEPWRNPPSTGCDEFYSSVLTGALGVNIRADDTGFVPGFTVNFIGTIFGRTGASRWDFGDGTFATNQFSVSHSWSSPGNYVVTFTAFNDSNPGGISATVTVHVVSNPVSYVSLNSTNSARRIYRGIRRRRTFRTLWMPCSLVERSS